MLLLTPLALKNHDCMSKQNQEMVDRTQSKDLTPQTKMCSLSSVIYKFSQQRLPQIKIINLSEVTL